MAIRSPYQMQMPGPLGQMQKQAQMIQQAPSMESQAAGMAGQKILGAAINKGIGALAPKAAATGLGAAAQGAAAAAPALTGALGAALPALGPLGLAAGAAGKVFGLFNQGGMVSNAPLAAVKNNPNGYNEGGAVMETPIKKVMDEQKLEQNALAFELDQKRKQEAHDMAMRQKQQQFAMAQKMKAASATTNKTAAKPKGPLSK